MNALYLLAAVVALFIIAAFLRRRSHSPLECPKCHSTNNYLTYGDHYAICQECAWEEHAARIAANKNAHN